MAKVLNQLIALLKDAKPVERTRLIGPSNEATHIWNLSDGATIVLTGTIRHQRTHPMKEVFATVERLDKPFKKVVANVKRSYTLSRKRMEELP
jgi:hypothetical protein